MGYRDDVAAAAEQLEALRADLGELKAAFPAHLEPYLDPDPARELSDQASLNETERCIDVWRAVLADLPRLEALARHVAPGYPDIAVRNFGQIRVTPKLKEVPVAYAQTIENVIGSCEMQQWYGILLGNAAEQLGWEMAAGELRFVYSGTRMRLTCNRDDFCVACFVARASPTISISPQTYVHAPLKAIGLVRELEVGEQAFDDAFLFKSPMDDWSRALELIDSDLREQLLQIARLDVPTLTIKNGVAALRWQFGVDGPLWTIAFDLLSRLQRRTVAVLDGGQS